MRGIKFAAAALCLAVCSGTTWAKEQTTELPRLTSEYVKDPAAFKLAANEPEVLVKKPGGAAPTARQPAFEPPMFSGSNVHKYLGIATVAAAAATFLTHKDRCEGAACAGPQPPRSTHNTHANFGKATAVLAAATVATGLLSHWDDFNLEDGLADPDNQHVLLGATGAALMMYAINKSARSNVPTSHAGVAELGALGMIVAIKLTW